MRVSGTNFTKTASNTTIQGVGKVAGPMKP